MRRHATILTVLAMALLPAAHIDAADRRYLNDFAKSGFFDRLWETKR